MRIYFTSVLVDDQEKALRFYTDVLGFVTKSDIPLGGARWLTVTSPDSPEGPELLLEPDTHPAAGPFTAALVADGIPATSFAVDDVHAEFQRLRGLDVLESAGLVRTRREGRYKFHHLDTTPLETIIQRWRPTRGKEGR
jgi:catechol 2,3-dioxygenase-like lactoylglutathione lyase family enzyme